MTRMIERWFPCTEVSESSKSGWGSGKSERNLFTWFAARPLASIFHEVLLRERLGVVRLWLQD